jgi:hypothetical protein
MISYFSELRGVCELNRKNHVILRQKIIVEHKEDQRKVESLAF